MFAMVNSKSTSLLLLRGGDLNGNSRDISSTDKILDIVNHAKNSRMEKPAAPAQVKSAEAKDDDLPAAGFRNPFLPNPSKYQNLSSEEVKRLTAQQFNSMGKNDIGGYVRYAQEFGNEAFRALAAKANGLNAFGASSIFAGKVVEATVLKNVEAGSWDDLVSKAEKQTSVLVGGIVLANAHFHKLDHIDAAQKGMDADVATLMNNYIDDEMASARMWASHYDQLAESANFYASNPDMSFKNLSVGYGVKTESGEYRIHAYKVMTMDEKHVIAEMREDGHFVTYNQDGSVRRERNRFEVCAELSNGMAEFGSSGTNFGRLATLVYNEEKDFMFY